MPGCASWGWPGVKHGTRLTAGMRAFMRSEGCDDRLAQSDPAQAGPQAGWAAQARLESCYLGGTITWTGCAQPSAATDGGTGDSAGEGTGATVVYSNGSWPTSIVEGSSALVLTSLDVPVQARLIIEPLAPANTPLQFCHGSAVFCSSSL